MQKGYVYKSVALHIAVAMLCIFDVPFLKHKRTFDEKPPIMVDLANIKIADKTNLPEKAVVGKEKKPATRKAQPKETASAKKQELPPPTPIQKPKKTPEPQPTPEPKPENQPQKIKSPSLIEEAPRSEESKEQPRKESEKPAKKKPAPIPAKKPKIKPTAKPAAKQPNTVKQAATKKDNRATKRTANPLQSLMDSVDNIQQQIGEENAPAQISAEDPVNNLGIEGGNSQGSYFSELSISGIDFVKTKIQESWQTVVGGKDDRNIEVVINVKLSKEGKIISVNIEDVGRYSRDVYFQALADSAERAIHRAQTEFDVFGVLSRQSGSAYNEWKEIRFTFTPLGLAK